MVFSKIGPSAATMVSTPGNIVDAVLLRSNINNTRRVFPQMKTVEPAEQDIQVTLKYQLVVILKPG